MAKRTLRADSARENPEHRWSHACAALVLAQADVTDGVLKDCEGIEINLLVGAHCEARDALLLTDAPNWEAVAHKLVVFRDDETYNLCEEAVNLYLNTIIADIRRLEARHGRA